MDESIQSASDGVVVVIALLFLAVFIIPFWFIFSKAGFPRWFSFFMVIPFFNLLFLYVLAFSKWPSLKEKHDKSQI